MEEIGRWFFSWHEFFIGGRFHDFLYEDSLLAPAHPLMVERLAKTRRLWNVSSIQFITASEDNSAHDAPVLNPGLAVGAWVNRAPGAPSTCRRSDSIRLFILPELNGESEIMLSQNLAHQHCAE